MRRSVVSLVCLLLGCGTVSAGRPALQRNGALSVLEQAAREPNATPPTVLALYLAYANSHHAYEGMQFFAERARAQPDQPLFLALEGVCQAKLVNEVGLFKQVGWVNEGLAKLDRAVEKDPGVSRYLRALVLAELPESFFHKSELALQELAWAIDNKEKFSPGLLRNVYRAQAVVYTGLGKQAEAREALAKSGYASLDPQAPQFTTDFITGKGGGFRYGPARLVERAPNVYAAEGYDFSDLGFIVTDSGVVAIDAGLAPENVKAAVAALRKITDKPVTHVIFTHTHYDHVGGLAALKAEGPSVTVIAGAGYPDEKRLEASVGIAYPAFYGPQGKHRFDVAVDRAVAKKETLTVGGVELVLHPVQGGETNDALVVELPKSGVVFAGDVLMPYVGAPFFNEGSPQGLIDAYAYLRALKPKIVVQGHTAMTYRFTPESFEGMEAALRETQAATLAAVATGRPLDAVLADAVLPGALKQHPSAVIPFVATREHFITRVYQRQTGYWAPGAELEPVAPDAWAAVLDLVADESDAALARTAKRLNGQGDYALALKVATLGLSRHPDSAGLSDARATALDGLRLMHEQTDPFRFFIYSEQRGAVLSPLP
jgi:glyoxylase-like metal-dependent hydrolase (beta-lactamase superfamily II)